VNNGEQALSRTLFLQEDGLKEERFREVMLKMATL
jgi:hypothetical protein